MIVWRMCVGRTMLLVIAGIVLRFDDFGEVGLALWTSETVLVSIPFVLALVTEDEVSLSALLVVVHGDDK